MEDARFRTVRTEDITSRVVAGLDRAAPALRSLADQSDDPEVQGRFAEYAGLPGSEPYRRFSERRFLYRSWVLTPAD